MSINLNKIIKRIFPVFLIAGAISFGLIMQTNAAISGGSVSGSSASDLVVNTSDASYDISFDTGIGGTSNQFWIIFPEGYTITNGDLGTSSVSDGTLTGRILVDGVSRSVDNVTGDAASRKITIVLGTPYDLGTGTGTSLTILSGIQNPTSVGATGTFTINSDASGETEESNITGVTLTCGPTHHFTVTGDASQTAGVGNELTVTAKDEWGNTATGYTGEHALTFSGPAIALDDSTNPTVEGTNIGTSQTVTFASGVTNGTNLTLVAYKAETTTVDVTDGSIDSTGDTSWDLDLTVNPATATSIDFSQQPSGSTSGSALTTQPIVTAYDDYGNIDTNFTETITLSTAAGSLGGDVDVAAVSGQATFTDVSYTATADGQSFTILADDDSGTGTDLGQAIASSVTSDVVATKLVFTQQPSANVTSATAFAQQPIVTAQNANNVTDTGYTSDVTLTNDAAGALGGTLTQTAALGVATFDNVSYTNFAVDHETFHLLANDGSLTQGTSDAVDPNVVATVIEIDAGNLPGSIVSGVSMDQPVINYVTAGGIIDTDVEDTIAVTQDGAGGLTGTTSVAATSGVVTFTDLVYSALADGESVTFTFTDDAGTVDLSSSPINSGALTADVVATKLVWTVAPSTCTSGFACETQGTIQAQNAQDLVDTGYTTSVTIAENEDGTLVGTAGQGAMTAGELTTSGIGYSATADGQQFTLTASSSGLTPDTTGSIDSNVVATNIIVYTEPGDEAATNGDVRNAIVFATQPVIRYVNAQNIVDVDIDSDVVTVSLTTGDGTLGGTATKTATNGVADFSGNDIVYTLGTEENDQQVIVLSFTDDAGGTVNFSSIPVYDSSTVDVVATKLSFLSEPTASISGVSLTPQPVLQALDAQDKLDTDYATDIVLATDDRGSISGTTTLTPTTGTATFTDIIYTANADQENFEIDATSGELAGASTATITSDVVATKFLVSLNTNTPTAGVADQMTLTAVDADETTDTGYDPAGLSYTFTDALAAGIISHVSPDATTPTIPNDGTIIAAFASGVANLTTFTLVNAEVLGTITVSDGALLGTSTSVTVSPATTSQFAVVPSSYAPTTADTIDVAVTAKDAYMNTNTAYTGTFSLQASGGSPSWSSQIGSISSGGVGTVSPCVTFNSAATVTVTANSWDTSITGTSSNVTVTQGGDIATPTVSAQYPLDNATDVAISVSPYIDFSEAMSRSTINSSTVKLCLVSDATCTSPISAQVSMAEGDTRAIISPVSVLQNSTDYWIYVTTGAKDVAGNSLESAYGSSEESNFTTATQPNGSLEVTGISTTKSYATADGTYGNGWAWKFNITVPTTETSLQMKFSNWTSGENTIATANNMRIYSAQSSNAANSSNAITITTAGTYSTALALNADLDSSTDGRQIEVIVEMKVPAGTSGGSYSASYGVFSEAVE